MQTWRQSDTVNINFGAKMSILCKKFEKLGEMLTFSLSVPYYWKWLCYLQNMPIFLENVTFVWRFLYTLTVSNYDKKLKFLRIC